jgi:hypothetical protein
MPPTTDDVLVIGDGWDDMNWWRVYFYENGAWHDIDGDEVNKASQMRITHWVYLEDLPKPPKL